VDLVFEINFDGIAPKSYDTIFASTHFLTFMQWTRLSAWIKLGNYTHSISLSGSNERFVGHYEEWCQLLCQNVSLTMFHLDNTSFYRYATSLLIS